MPAVATIGVNDNFPSGQAAVGVRATIDETSGRVHQKRRLLIQKLRRNDALYDFFHHGLFDRVIGRVRVVLSGNQDRIGAHRFAIPVFHRHLRLAVRAQEGQFAPFPYGGHFLDQAVGRINGKRHIVFGFIAGKTEHHALVARALFFVEALSGSHSLRNIRRLSSERRQDRAGIGIKAQRRVDKTNITHHLPNHFHITDLGARCDFTRYDDHAGFDHRFARHPTVRILFDQGVQDAVRYLVTHFVRVTF